MTNKNWLKIFDRAYDKCAMLLPGQDLTLTEDEERILLHCIYKRRRRIKWRSGM